MSWTEAGRNRLVFHVFQGMCSRSPKMRLLSKVSCDPVHVGDLSESLAIKAVSVRKSLSLKTPVGVC